MKRLLTILAVLVICTLLTIGAGIMLLRSSRVQTAMVSALAEQLSYSLQADVHIGKVDFRFPKSLVVSDFYLSDQAHDTLVAVPELQLQFNPFAIDSNRLDFPLVRISDPYIHVKQDSAGTNIDFLRRAFQPDDTIRKPFAMSVNVDDIFLNNARIRYENTSIDKDILLSDINCTLHLPVWNPDTLSAQLDQLSLAAQMRGLDAKIYGSFHGNLDTLYANQLDVNYRNERILLADIELDQPLKKDSMSARITCQDLYMDAPLLQDLLSDLTKHPVHLPQPLYRMGKMHYRGELAGKLNDMNLHGIFLSSIGSITTTAHVIANPQNQQYQVDGKFQTNRFDLGRALNNSDFSTMAGTISLKGTMVQNQPLHATGNAHINHLTFRDYTYHDIAVNGQVHDSIFEGNIRIQDENIQLHADGLMDFSSSEPMANVALRLEHLRLKELNLSDKYDNQDLALKCDVSLNTEGEGTTITDRLNGYVVIDSLLFSQQERTLNMQQLKLMIDKGDTRSLRLQSDFFTAGVSGQFEWSSLPNWVRHFAYGAMPSLTNPQKLRPLPKDQPTELDFYCYLHDLDTIIHALGYDQISFPRRQTIKGNISSLDSIYTLQAFIPSIRKANMELKDVTLSLIGDSDDSNIAFSLVQHNERRDSIQGTSQDVTYIVSSAAHQDSVLTRLQFGEVHSKHPSADLHVMTHIGRYQNAPLIHAHILPSTFYLRDTLWRLDESYMEWNSADTALSIHDFQLSSSNQYIRANGMASTHAEDSIRIDLQDIDLHSLLQYINLDRSIRVDGLVSGWATIYSTFSTPMFEAKLHMPDAHLNYTSLGELNAGVKLDHETHSMLIDGVATKGNHAVATVEGQVIPQEGWELNIQADSVDLGMINYWTTGIVEQIQGTGYGPIHVFGRKERTWVTGKVLANQASLIVPATKCRYHFTDTIIMDTTAILFPDIAIKDDEGNRATLNGRINHDCFRQFDYQLGISCRKTLALNIPYDEQELFYGKCYASGQVAIFGNDENCHINISASTAPKTSFFFNTSTASTASENSFITFTSSESTPSPFSLDTLSMPKPKSSLHLDMSLHVTPEAQIHLSLNPHNGDGITGHGEGDIHLSLNDNQLQLLGNYTLQAGTISYSIGNIVHRDFTIAEGSRITWNGEAEDPVLDITARYHLTASLRDLFGTDAATIATNRTSVPVNCIIYLTEKLSNPVLRFGIDLPQSDESINSQVRSIINTDEMMMRQIVYLLVFNKFFTPEYLRAANSVNTGVNETYSLLSSTVTGQINQWLGRLSDVFSMGFNVRSEGEGQSASQEYEAQFQLNPIDRLTINGNFGYRYNDISNRPFFGDVDIEYGLTSDGKLRAKAYTHTVDKYSLKQANTVQGIGFIYRHDFNWGDAKRANEMRKAQKEQNSRRKTKSQTTDKQ